MSVGWSLATLGRCPRTLMLDSIPCNQQSESCWALERKAWDDEEWGWRASRCYFRSPETSGSTDSEMPVRLTFGPTGGARPWHSCCSREAMACSSWLGEEVEKRGAGTQPGSGSGTSGLQNWLCQSELSKYVNDKMIQCWNDQSTW